MKLKTILLFGVLLISASACSVLTSGRKGSVYEKAVVAGVAADYLGALLRQDTQSINVVVLWDDFIENAPGELTKEVYFKQLRLLEPSQWKSSEHPLTSLDIIDIQFSGNLADVSLQKVKNPDAPKIKIILFWTGGGWLIAGDTLFGTEGLLHQLG